MENKLEIGMYAYSKESREKGIGKIIEIDDKRMHLEVTIKTKKGLLRTRRDYVEASYDITDLIEVADVVVLQYKNKYGDIVSRKFEVERITEEYIVFVSRRADWVYNKEEQSFIDDFTLGQPVIKEILTHEQFEQYSYKIGE